MPMLHDVSYCMLHSAGRVCLAATRRRMPASPPEILTPPSSHIYHLDHPCAPATARSRRANDPPSSTTGSPNATRRSCRPGQVCCTVATRRMPASPAKKMRPLYPSTTETTPARCDCATHMPHTLAKETTNRAPPRES